MVYGINDDDEWVIENDIRGLRFGKLVAIGWGGPRQSSKLNWDFKCDCGRSIWRHPDDVVSGKYLSCGCIGRRDPEYRVLYPERKRIRGILRGMIERCYNPESAAYRYYGARGIDVDPYWRANPTAFIAWSLVNGYRSDLTVDRIDNRLGYWAHNVRWATMEQQANNKMIHQERREAEAEHLIPISARHDIRAIAGLLSNLG
jgi:hypothetical protein